MTPEQKQVVERIGRELKLIFPVMHGSIQFHMNPDCADVMVKEVINTRFKDVEND